MHTQQTPPHKRIRPVASMQPVIRTLRGSLSRQASSGLPFKFTSAFRTPHSVRHHSSLPNVNMEQKLLQSGNDGAAYVLAPELTWTGERFERDVRVHVGGDGLIRAVTHAGGDAGVDVVVHSLPGRALLPGMVNAHSHAFQRGLRGLGETYPKDATGESSFWTWREEMYKLVGGMSETQIYDLTRQCFSEMRDAGITSVGEFHYFHHGRPGEGKDGEQFAYDETVLRAAKDVGIRIVLLNAYYEHGGFQRAPMSESQKRFKVDSHDMYWTQMDALQAKLAATPTQSVGVVAHSMRAVEVPDIVKLHEESVRRGLVFHIHLEEQTKEVEDCKAAHDGETPMALLLKNLKIDEKFTAVHCTWTKADELKQFVDKKGNVCICPLTEGEIKEGYAADFALVDTEEEQLKFSTASSLMGAFIFGANGSSVVKATSVNGKWRQTVSKEIQHEVENGDADSSLSDEHRAQMQAAAALADVTSDDVVKLSCGLNSIQSTSGEEATVGKAIQDWLTVRGWQVHMQKVSPQPDAAVKADR
ncbi:hypothetical protein BBJ28_00009102 [Nothophytophthora sp. Chile5]|nr:hypothetical protein BBJ28_00009102 [Nothophytophthora sp. Chile5]